MQNIVIIARNGGNALADQIRRAVVSEEIERMKASHERQIDDLTFAHHFTEARLSEMRCKELARIGRSMRMSRWERVKDAVSTAWGIFWGILFELGLVEYVPDDEEDEL